ncbi:zonular occludens toxin domain-containing protein [Massilia sp. NR 4-1]|uniref:zonular occludens toxin domain-containing protein n=1 Tax=Massilia sp. NR 4-1 TaxID=1678028 RepID=UPI00067D38D9|nr:zonular occludens toxin domain-containing protein [Massilia sp. NR 4-1]AKU20992.1 hypothetical protein ACZ75_05265 [Massilia sp. NR 4-1]
MAINAYTGVMGSGKSYEVVSEVVLPAILSGRDVVTNIAGINEAKIHDYLHELHGIERDKLGHVRHVSNDDVIAPGFFPDEEDPDRPSMVKGGDLVAIDEAWRFWATGEKISKEHMQFFRMHRHYVHPISKVSCDVAMMVQSITDMNRSIRAVVELTCVMTKLKRIGMNKSYRVDMYEGGKTQRATKFETYVKRYDKRIFPLYQSYTGGTGTEKAIDSRQNVLKNPRLWLVAVGMLLLLGGCIWLFSFVYHRQVEKNTAERDVAATIQQGQATAAAIGSSAAAPAGGQVPGSGSTAPRSGMRVAGEVWLRGERWVLVVDEQGAARYENPAAFVGRGVLMVGNIEGQRVTTWSGAQARPQSIVGGGK